VLANAGAWWKLSATRRGRLAVAGLLVGVGVTFGPLAYQHVRHPETIGRRANANWIWRDADPWSARLGAVWDRYLRHYEPDFLYKRGDPNEVVFAAGFGFLPGYLLPLQLIGLAWLLSRLRTSRAARLLLAGIVLYPAADLLNWYVSLHGLRSLPGLVPLLMLAALGLVQPVQFLARYRLRAAVVVVGGAVGGAACAATTRFLVSYGQRPKQPAVYNGTHMDLLEACAWLRPRLEQVDVVSCTTIGMNQPYAVMLVALNHQPQEWFAEPRVFQTVGTWDFYARYGKFYFQQERERRELLAELAHNGHPDRIILFMRPDELDPGGELAYRVVGPEGKPTLLVYDVTD
jgi:hypothetical protein